MAAAPESTEKDPSTDRATESVVGGGQGLGAGLILTLAKAQSATGIFSLSILLKLK